MSENTELVRRSFEAMSAWNLEALLGLYDPDIEFLPLTGARVETGDTGAMRAHARTSPRPVSSGTYWSPRATSTGTSATASW